MRKRLYTRHYRLLRRNRRYKEFIAEKDLDSATRFVPKMLNQTGRPYTEKIAVIGAGPAGLSCAYYLAVKGYP